MDGNLLTLPTDHILRIALITFIAIGLRLAVAIFITGFVKKISGRISRTRVATLSSLLSAVLSTLIYIVTFIIILKEIGFDVTPLLASAGVVGIALAFGAQTVVKDVLGGFFLLIEDQFREGETIEAGGKKGVVEKATLRQVSLREKDGDINFIPYSSITVVTNFSRKNNG
jgi:small-conductance mechanosensitive channel